MLIIWRTCRIWLRTEWSVQIEHISTSMMYQNGRCIKLRDHERWQLSALDLGASFQMRYCVRGGSLGRSYTNPRMSRRCSSCIVKKSFQVLRGAMGNSRFFRCGNDGGNVVTDALHDGLGTRRHGFFGDNLYPMYVYWLAHHLKNCSKTPWRMRGSAGCSKFQCF